jgi:amino acid adenylation domain-containing protein
MSNQDGTRREPGTLTELFSRSVRMFAKRPAVSDDRRSFTYEELDAASGRLARRLQMLGVGDEDRVGIYMSRSVDVIVAVLGVLKAGAGYVAVDTRYPDARRDHMLRASGAKTVLVQSSWAERIHHLGLSAVVVDGDSEPADESAAVDVSPSNAASILFTSGSSGEPKGILLEHRNIVAFALNPSLPPLTPDDRMGQVSSLSFDAFHFEMWTTLARGGEIVVLPPVPELLATDIRRQLKRRRITVMLVPTMVLNHVVREDRDAFSSLRILCVGGDVLLPSAARELLTGEFTGRLYNLYGPAEITTACSGHQVSLADTEHDSVPVGRPLDGFTIYVMGPDGRPAGPDVVGEIYVGGPGVARGYLGPTALTEERFVGNPIPGGPPRLYRTGDLAQQGSDGTLEFVGRADRQVKIRGYRVEPGEVERTLRRCGDVRDAVVMAADGAGHEPRLVAFVEIEKPVTLEVVRNYAKASLPHFMVPSQFVAVAEVPANDHGKRDFDALRELLAQEDQRRADYAEPVGATERWLADAWGELLSVEAVGRNDDFFDLGGHSILAFRMRSRVERALGVSLAFGTLLEHSTLRELAARIDDVKRTSEPLA